MEFVRGRTRRFAGLVKRNPVRAQALVQATIGVATAFGLGWTAQQVGAVMVLSAGILAFLTETAVTPIDNPTLPAGTDVTVVTPEGQPDRVATI